MIDDDDSSAARGSTELAKDVARAQWSDVNRTIIHFNEIIHRTRQLTATVVLASFGAALASFTAKPSLRVHLAACLPDMHVATPIILLGMLSLGVGFALDRRYYTRLLLGSVQVAQALELDFDLPAKLTVALGKVVPPTHAVTMLRMFYLTGLVIGIFLMWFVNVATEVG
jgi:hypothetical protein